MTVARAPRHSRPRGTFRDDFDRGRLLREAEHTLSAIGAGDMGTGEDSFAPGGPEFEDGGMSTFSDSLSASFQVTDLTSPGAAPAPWPLL